MLALHFIKCERRSNCSFSLHKHNSACNEYKTSSHYTNRLCQGKVNLAAGQKPARTLRLRHERQEFGQLTNHGVEEFAHENVHVQALSGIQ